MNKLKLLFLHELNSFLKDGRSLGIIVLMVIVLVSSIVSGAYKTRALIIKSELENQNVVKYLESQKSITDIRRLTYLSLGPERLAMFCPQAAAEQTKKVLLPDMRYSFNFTFLEAESSDWFKSGILDKFDYSHSIKFILAVFVLIMGAVSITKEKEAGTLKYLSAASVPLGSVVAAKSLSGVILVFLSFFLAVTMSLLYIEFAVFPGIFESIVEISVITINGALLISLFYFVGVAVSLFVYSSLQAVIIGIAIWAVTLFALPLLPQLLAGGNSSRDERTEQQVMTEISREESSRAWSKEVQELNKMRFANKEADGIYNNPRYRALREQSFREHADSSRARYEAHMAEKINGARTSMQNVSSFRLINPFSSFDDLIIERADLDFQSKADSYSNIVRYARQYKEYLDSKEKDVNIQYMRIRNEDGDDGFLKWTFQDRKMVSLDLSDRPGFEMQSDSGELLTPQLIRFLVSVAIWLFICTVLIVVRIRYYDIR